MQHGIFTYPWELADQCYDNALDEIAAAGFTNVNLAMQYHNGKFLLPRNPNRRVYYAEDGAVSFRPDRHRYGAMQPRTHSLVTPSSSPAEEVAKRMGALGMNLVGWTVCLHNRWLGEQFPEATQHTVFGDPLLNSLSPAHPLVREYLIALVSDMVSQFPMHAIQMESPGYMGFVHGEHHEIIGTAFDRVQADLMNLSFSTYEIDLAMQAGIPATQLRDHIAVMLDASMNQGVSLTNEDGSPTSAVEALADLGLPEYSAWLKQHQLSLVTEVRDAVKTISPGTQIWHFAKLDGSPEDAALVTSGDATLAGYALSDEDALRRGHDAAKLGRPVRGAIRAIAPDTTEPLTITQRKIAWEQASVAGIDVYNYGLMNGVIWKAVTTAFESRTLSDV